MTTHVRRRRSARLPWLLILLVGLVGLVLGLLYAWFVDPVGYVDVEPAQLNQEDRRTYMILVGLAYASDGDLSRASLRLGALGLDENVGATLAAAADEAVAQGLAERSVRALTNLALAFGGQPGVAMAFAGTLPPPPTFAAPPATDVPFIPPPTEDFSPTPTLLDVTPTPSPEGGLTPTPTPRRDRYVLVDLTATCEADQSPGLLTVFVQDTGGDGVPGVEVRVEWEGGQDSFFTGLKPEYEPGYADFSMVEDRVYRLRVMEGSLPASSASAEFRAGSCTPTDDAEPRLGGYQAVFRETS